MNELVANQVILDSVLIIVGVIFLLVVSYCWGYSKGQLAEIKRQRVTIRCNKKATFLNIGNVQEDCDD